MLPLLAVVLLFFLLAIIIISMFNSSNNNKIKEQVEELRAIETIMIAKRSELESLEQQLQNKAINRESNLSNVVSKVLDIYEESSIRIPLDIIEELQFIQLSDEKQVFDYIENQRNIWVFENRKKPYRRVK